MTKSVQLTLCEVRAAVLAHPRVAAAIAGVAAPCVNFVPRGRSADGSVFVQVWGDVDNGNAPRRRRGARRR